MKQNDGFKHQCIKRHCTTLQIRAHPVCTSCVRVMTHILGVLHFWVKANFTPKPLLILLFLFENRVKQFFYEFRDIYSIVF